MQPSLVMVCFRPRKHPLPWRSETLNLLIIIFIDWIWPKWRAGEKRDEVEFFFFFGGIPKLVTVREAEKPDP